MLNLPAARIDFRPTFQVVEETGLPPGVCGTCAEDITRTYHCKQLCLSSIFNWETAVNSLSLIDGPSDKDKTYYVFYDNGVDTIVKDQVSKVSNVKEAYALLTFKIHPATESLPIKKDKRIKVAVPCKCPYCNMSFDMPLALNSHLKNSSVVACTDCGMVVAKEKLAKHLGDEHNVIVHPCERCHKVFDSLKQLQTHVDQHEGDVHHCKSCGFMCSNARGLRAHMYSHSLFHCPTCNASFENRKCFLHHQKGCSNSDDRIAANLFICHDCGAKYDKKPSLKIHIIQKHLRVLPYVCQICGKKASTLAHLKSHQTIHNKERKIFSCTCGAKMRTYLGYQLHQRLHSGEKPYQCDECGDCFLSASRRLDHIKRRHRSTRDMPHGCDQCSARFVRPFELKKHYLSSHYTVVDVKPLSKGVRNTLLLEEPCLPSGACVACAGAIIAAQEFKCLVRSSQEIWTEAINTLSLIPAEASSNTPIKSVYAFINRDSKDNLSVHVVKNQIKESPKNVINRLTMKLPERKKTDRRPRMGKALPCDCPDCGQRFISPYYLNQHLKNSGYKAGCILCGAVLMRGQEMKDHLSSVHKQTVYICGSCPSLFGSKDELKKHSKVAHRPGALTCGDCGRTFPRVGAFEAHSQMHAVRTCRSCGTQFTNRGCYRKHRANCEPTAKPDIHSLSKNKRSNVRDPAVFVCDYCKKYYNTRAQLKNHIIWIHMDVRPHQCQTCGKRFYTPARLAEHSVVHTRERNYECDLCGAKLVSKMAAVYHRRRHTGEKPYKCEDCEETFISASRRSEHAKRRHNKGTRLPCKLCLATFVRGHELRKHIDKAHKTDINKPLGNKFVGGHEISNNSIITMKIERI